MDDAGNWFRWLVGGLCAFYGAWMVRLEGRISSHTERREMESLERDIRSELSKMWSSVSETRKGLSDLSGDFRALQAQVVDLKERLGTMSADVSATLRIVSRLEAEVIRRRRDEDDHDGRGQQ